MKKITEESLRMAIGIIEGQRAKADSLMKSARAATDDDFDALIAEYTQAAAKAAELSANAAPLLFGRARKPAKDKPAAAPKPAKAARKPRAAKPKASEDANITEAGIDAVYEALPGPAAKHEAPSAIAARLKMTTAATRAALDVLKKNDKAVRIGAAAGHWRKAKA